MNVRVKAPPGTGAVQISSGQHINVGLDGIVEMSEGDASGPYSATPDPPARQANHPSGSK